MRRRSLEIRVRGGLTTSPRSEAKGGEDADVLELGESYICGVGWNNNTLLLRPIPAFPKLGKGLKFT